MNRVLSAILVIIIMFLTTIVQIYLLNTDIFFGVKPNLMFIMVAVVSLWYGSYIGSFYGLLSGFILDNMFSSTLGFYMTIFFILGMVIGLFTKTLQREKKSPAVYIVFYFTFAMAILNVLMLSILYDFKPDYLPLLTRTLLEGVLNGFIVIVIYKALLKFGDLMDIAVDEI